MVSSRKKEVNHHAFLHRSVHIGRDIWHAIWHVTARQSGMSSALADVRSNGGKQLPQRVLKGLFEKWRRRNERVRATFRPRR